MSCHKLTLLGGVYAIDHAGAYSSQVGYSGRLNRALKRYDKGGATSVSDHLLVVTEGTSAIGEIDC